MMMIAMYQINGRRLPAVLKMFHIHVLKKKLFKVSTLYIVKNLIKKIIIYLLLIMY